MNNKQLLIRLICLLPLFSTTIQAAEKRCMQPRIDLKAAKAAVSPTVESIKPPAATDPAGPDLVPYNINLNPGKPAIGQEVTIWVHVYNDGNTAKSEATTVSILLTPAVNIPGQAYKNFSAIAPLEALDPGKIGIATFKIVTTGAGFQGSWKAIAVTDDKNMIVESNEQNNSAYQLFSMY